MSGSGQYINISNPAGDYTIPFSYTYSGQYNFLTNNNINFNNNI